MKIISYIQSTEGQINNNSLEAFAAAQKICSENNGQIYLLTFDKEAANKLPSYNSDGIILMSNDLLKDYNPIYFLHSLENIYEEVKSSNPEIIDSINNTGKLEEEKEKKLISIIEQFKKTIK